MNWYICVPIPKGCGPPNVAHPISLPYSRPGKISFFVCELTTGLYIVCADRTCAEVRQLEESPAVHCSTFGSNLHCRGFSMTLSFTPSSASHAWSTASWIAGYFAGGM